MTDEPAKVSSFTRAELEAFIPVAEGAKLRGVHVDTFKEVEKERIVRVSPKRDAIRRKHALLLED